MTKSLKNLWGRFLFRGKGILPTKRLIVLIIAVSLSLIVVTVWNKSLLFVIGVDTLVLLLSLVDLAVIPSKHAFHFNRTIPAELERGLTYSVQVKIKNLSNRPISYRFIDGLPQSFKKVNPVFGKVEKEETMVVSYQIIAPVRGKYQITNLHFRFSSMLGLWEKQFTVELEDTVKVIPDLTDTKQYLESAQRFLQYEGTIIRKRQKGVGEFAKIRNYVVGDDPRKINWRQTAKLQEVMTNEYEPEHGKYITILIDCGRMMGAELKVGNRLEKALEAVLTVAAAALKKGDYVSVLAFSKDIKMYVPPAKGMEHLQKILQAIYNLQVDANESNYAAVFQYLESVQKKRSLILLFSDVHTFLHEETTLIFLKRLRLRHLFFMIGIEDHTLLQRVKDEPRNVQIAMMKSIAQQQQQIKKREKNKWEKQGLQMIEAKEEQLAIAAVSYYIDTMNRDLL
ncbi:DUF58 domain-containing protein [Aquibacillus rhizosphaerae]|uniref:DUF58 domain-containing protein n=1 Tax=Aquibacillus rhizosphaerae TaxID=3051431 RepID=A0ABT7L4A4_9BACI|nr:DUF58 domain-containing protein [Aquibacillus sp. LR5S19]MDL4840701.1 DUF58 domain-containing protein [Aquibacillus sp. LR5S19]